MNGHGEDKEQRRDRQRGFATRIHSNRHRHREKQSPIHRQGIEKGTEPEPGQCLLFGSAQLRTPRACQNGDKDRESEREAQAGT